MSTIANWSYKSKATIWRAGARDEQGDRVFADPIHIDCAFSLGSSSDTSDGKDEIKPDIVVYTELLSGGAIVPQPELGDLISIGEHVGPPVSSARIVTSVIRYDMAAMSAGFDDYEVECKGS